MERHPKADFAPHPPPMCHPNVWGNQTRDRARSASIFWSKEKKLSQVIALVYAIV